MSHHEKRRTKHQWYYVRRHERSRRRRTRGRIGDVICLRRGCKAQLGRSRNKETCPSG